MTLAETIYQHSLKLPEAAAREALDFIQFLEHHYAPIPDMATSKNATADTWEARVLAVAGTVSEDFPDDIDDANVETLHGNVLIP
ncbi:MAG: DUF2281 domain-containing protein [Methylovulum sp.]|nr:DUF2281 domain-containing protein [Methylovulum sp.]